jgi:3-dehydroquinate dehydratase-2
MKILVIHGPNLNLLGSREPEIYGTATLAQIDSMLVRHGREMGVEVDSFQSNHEGDIIDRIQGAAPEYAVIVINPGAYAHTSLAIADAIRSVKTPVVEVHLTNIHARGHERALSLTASMSRGIISGFGADSYLLGLDAAVRLGAKRRRKAADERTRKGSRTRRKRA